MRDFREELEVISVFFNEQQLGVMARELLEGKDPFTVMDSEWARRELIRRFVSLALWRIKNSIERPPQKRKRKLVDSIKEKLNLA